MLVPESEIGLLWRPDFLCHPNSSILRSRRRAVDSEGLKVLRRPGRDKQGEGNQRNQIRNAEISSRAWHGPDWKTIFLYNRKVFRFHVGLFQLG